MLLCGVSQRVALNFNTAVTGNCADMVWLDWWTAHPLPRYRITLCFGKWARQWPRRAGLPPAGDSPYMGASPFALLSIGGYASRPVKPCRFEPRAYTNARPGGYMAMIGVRTLRLDSGFCVG